MFGINRTKAITGILCGAILLAAGSANAGDDQIDPWQIHIGQVTPQTDSRVHARSTVNEFEAMNMDPRIKALVRLGERLSKTTVVQEGRKNTAISNTKGAANVTGQFQNGSGNFSNIDIAGDSNKVVTFQNGNKAYSDIEVVGGNKTIFHMQFGETQRIKELPFKGSEKEKYLVIDKGRHGAYIARVK